MQAIGVPRSDILQNPHDALAGLPSLTPCLLKEHCSLLAVFGMEALQASQAPGRKAQHTRWCISCRSFGHAILRDQEQVGRAAGPAKVRQAQDRLGLVGAQVLEDLKSKHCLAQVAACATKASRESRVPALAVSCRKSGRFDQLALAATT